MLIRLACVLLLTLGFGCGSLETGKVPVESPLNEFEPPEEDEILNEGGEDDDDWDMEEDEPEGEPAAEPAAQPAEPTEAPKKPKSAAGTGN